MIKLDSEIDQEDIACRSKKDPSKESGIENGVAFQFWLLNSSLQL